MQIDGVSLSSYIAKQLFSVVQQGRECGCPRYYSAEFIFPDFFLTKLIIFPD